MARLAPKLLRYVRPYRWRFAAALGQVFVMSAFDLLKPWPLQLVIDGALGGRLPPALAALGWSKLALAAGACGALVLIAIGSGALTVLYNWQAIGLGQRMVHDLRGQL